MGSTVSVGTLELQHDLARTITLEPFVGNGWTGDIAAQAFELRLEEMTKRFGVQVVMSEDASDISDSIAGWPRHQVEVRGRVGTITVLVSDAGPS